MHVASTREQWSQEVRIKLGIFTPHHPARLTTLQQDTTCHLRSSLLPSAEWTAHNGTGREGTAFG